MKTIVVISDTHCGHDAGLTPPDYQYEKKSAWGKLQRACWDFYYSRAPHGADALLLLGDAIDGKGLRSGSTEQATTNRHRQAKIASECALALKPKRVIMAYGTGYHVGTDEDWEDVVAEKIRADGTQCDIGPHEAVDVDGVVFDVKHKVGSSQVPHGRHTATAREREWNIHWYLRGQRPLANVIIRSHVHYHQFCGDSTWLGLTTPGLMGLGCKYGSRECSGVVDFGFIVFKIDAGKIKSWYADIMPLSLMPTKPIVV